MKKIFKLLNKTPIGQTKWFQILLNEEIKRERNKINNTRAGYSETECEVLSGCRVYQELSEEVRDKLRKFREDVLSG